MIRQGQLVDEVSSQIPQDVTGSWKRLIYTRRALSMYAREDMVVHRPDGTVGSALPPLAMEDSIDELRSVMYQPGVGTWFSATWTLECDESGSVSVDVDFDYDNEPDWGQSVSPATFAIDLEDFPRDDENTPSWLAKKAAEARREAR